MQAGAEPWMIAVTILAMLLKLAPIVLAVGMIWFFAKSETWRLMKRRLTEGGEQAEQVALMAGEIEQLRREMAELQERVDFSERVLAQNKDVGTLERH
jgi:Tfp pilus assembly protein PilO